MLLICSYTIIISENKAEEQTKTILMTAVEKKQCYANKAKSAFLLSISHDIRTLMNANIGLTNIALHQNNRLEIFAIVWRNRKPESSSLLNDIWILLALKVKSDYYPTVDIVSQLTDNVQAIMNGLLYTEILSLNYIEKIPKEPICPCGCCAYPKFWVNLLAML